jgi:hypothetical protein
MSKLRIQLSTSDYYEDDPAESFRDGSRDFRKAFAKLSKKLKLKETNSGYDGDGAGFFEFEADALSGMSTDQVEKLFDSVECDFFSCERKGNDYTVSLCIENPDQDDEDEEDDEEEEEEEEEDDEEDQTEKESLHG